MKTLSGLYNLPLGSILTEDLITDFTYYFEIKNKIFNSVDMFRSVHWFKILKDLKKILDKYYNIKENDNFSEYQNDNERVLYGGYINLIDKYKEKFIKNVKIITIKSAYPQQIDKMFMNGMKTEDPYIPFIFHIVFKGIKKQTTLRKIFINYLYGLIVNRTIKIDRDISEVSEFYRNIWSQIDKKLYYYIDTDMIMFNKKNYEIIKNIFTSNYIDFIEEEASDVLFLNKKQYITIQSGKFKAIGLKQQI